MDKEIQNSELTLEVTLKQSQNSFFGIFKLPRFSVSSKLKKAFVKEIELRQGLMLVINDYKPKKTKIINVKVDIPPLEFVFCLSGKAYSELTDQDGNTYTILIEKGKSAVFYFPESEGIIKAEAEEPLLMVSLHVSPDFLREFLESDTSRVPSELLSVINGDDKSGFFISREMNMAMLQAAQSICNCSEEGISRKLFFESKSLELMTLLLDSLPESKNEDSPLLQNEIDAIEKIRLILEEKYADPPTLAELAQEAAMAHTKLGKGFKSLFHTTVFGYLRRYRLEQSKIQIEFGAKNITEIAFDNGWSSPSHFSREFIKYYGINPKTYQKEALKLKAKQKK